MDCREAKALIEKLADEEASDGEARDARAHLTECASCRADHELLVALSRAAARPLPEPPPGYFEALPERILARIEATAPSAPSRSLWKRLLAPDALRWEALAAVLLAAVAVGLVVEREGLLQETRGLVPEVALPTTPAPPLEEADEERLDDEAVSEASGERPSLEGALRQPVTAEPRVARDRRQRTQPEQAVAAFEAPSGPVASPEAQNEAEAQREEPVERNELKLAGRAAVRAASPAPAAESLADALTASGNDCERWRRYLEETVPEGDEAREARYRLARCSFERFRSDETRALRETAMADAEAFLDIESEGSRAEEIREILDRLR